VEVAILRLSSNHVENPEAIRRFLDVAQIRQFEGLGFLFGLESQNVMRSEVKTSQIKASHRPLLRKVSRLLIEPSKATSLAAPWEVGSCHPP
jgi:hypothetical protein